MGKAIHIQLNHFTSYDALHGDRKKQEKLSQWIRNYSFGGAMRYEQKRSLKKERVLALDEFSEMNEL